MKTAVEWLVDKILTKDEIYDDYGNLIGYKLINTFTSSVDLTEYVNEAKEMDKERIKYAYLNGRYDADKIVMSDKFYAEQYYNETFSNSPEIPASSKQTDQ
jgi:hypothetical protein